MDGTVRRTVSYLGIFLVSILRKHALIKFQHITANLKERNKCERAHFSSGPPTSPKKADLRHRSLCVNNLFGNMTTGNRSETGK